MHDVVGIMTGAVVHDIEHKDAPDQLPKVNGGEQPAQPQGGTPAA